MLSLALPVLSTYSIHFFRTMKLQLTLAGLTLGSVLSAQPSPENWFNKDLGKDGAFGVSTERAYEELLKGRGHKTVIVAVIDSGVDINHEDLKDKIWKNKAEIAGNGVDDDKNGYADDVTGWNFIGGKNGNVVADQLEMTRIVKMFKEKCDKGASGKDCILYQRAKAEFDGKKAEYEDYANRYGNMVSDLQQGFDMLKAKAGEPLTLEKIEALNPGTDELLTEWKKRAIPVYKAGSNFEAQLARLNDGLKQINGMLSNSLNLDGDFRSVVGDNYAKTSERHYGNSTVDGEHSFHGTHVAGIIAANRNNDLGIKGVCDDCLIMPIRCVPDGDERDKDVANSIRYAVDNGARVVNMSFGKNFGTAKKEVDKAVKYAEKKGVLLIHAAGNDSYDVDVVEVFPSKGYGTDKFKKQAKNWMDVGASSHTNNEELPAEFSNYGKRYVDVFAPGVQIYSCAPGSKYEYASGTSMAAPTCAGVAAMLMSYFPEFSAEQIKDIIMRSAIPVEKMVNKPGAEEGQATVSFKELCQTGAVVNVYEAVKLALNKSRKN